MLKTILTSAALILAATAASAATVDHHFNDSSEILDSRYAEVADGPWLEADPALGTLTGLRFTIRAVFALSIFDAYDPAPHWVTGCASLDFFQLGAEIEGCGRRFQRRNFASGPDKRVTTWDSFLFTDQGLLDEVLAGNILLDYLPIGYDAGGTVRFRSVLTYFYDEPAVSQPAPAVPLPASALLLFGAVAPLALGRRRKRGSPETC